MKIPTERKDPYHANPPHHICQDRPSVSAPVRVTRDEARQCGQGEEGNGWGAQVADLFDTACGLADRRSGIHGPAQNRDDGKDDEEEEIEDVHDVGQDLQTFELVWQLVHYNAEDAGVHGDCEPHGCKILDRVPPGWLMVFSRHAGCAILPSIRGTVDLLGRCALLRLEVARVHDHGFQFLIIRRSRKMTWDYEKPMNLVQKREKRRETVKESQRKPAAAWRGLRDNEECKRCLIIANAFSS